MRLAKAEEARDQPFGREGIKRADIDDAARLIGDRRRCRGKPLERLAHRARIGLAGGVSCTALTARVKSGDAQMFLEMADGAADRAMGDMQFIGRLGEAQMAGGGLEARQRRQGRQAARHRHPPMCE